MKSDEHRAWHNKWLKFKMTRDWDSTWQVIEILDVDKYNGSTSYRQNITLSLFYIIMFYKLLYGITISVFTFRFKQNGKQHCIVWMQLKVLCGREHVFNLYVYRAWLLWQQKMNNWIISIYTQQCKIEWLKSLFFNIIHSFTTFTVNSVQNTAIHRFILIYSKSMLIQLTSNKGFLQTQMCLYCLCRTPDDFLLV